MRVPDWVIRLAERRGVDVVIDLWRLWHEDPTCYDENGQLRPRMRSYRTYLRHQRNLYIHTLAACGTSGRDIQRLLQRDLGEKLRVDTIQCIARKMRKATS